MSNINQTNLAVLRAVGDADVEAMYLASGDRDLARFWQLGGETPPPEVFRRAMFDGVLARFMVVDPSDSNVRFGSVAAYAADHSSGHCSVRVSPLVPPARVANQLTAGLEGLIDHLFEFFTFGKVYLELADYEREMTTDTFLQQLSEEATFKHHKFLGGQHWSQSTFAVYRATWIGANGVSAP